MPVNCIMFDPRYIGDSGKREGGGGGGNGVDGKLKKLGVSRDSM